MATQKGGCFLINLENKKIAIVYRKLHNDYSFPKGHIEEGEDVKACAIRETIEETGHSCELLIDTPIYNNSYVSSKGEEVEVLMYLAKDTGVYSGFIDEKDKEICEWVEIDKVYDMLSYEDLKKMWLDVKEKIIEALK